MRCGLHIAHRLRYELEVAGEGAASGPSESESDSESTGAVRMARPRAGGSESTLGRQPDLDVGGCFTMLIPRIVTGLQG